MKTVNFLVSIKRSCSSSSDQHDESPLMIYVVLFYCICCRHCIWRRKVRQVVRGPGAATISVTNHQPASDTSILLSSTLFLLVQSPRVFPAAALVRLNSIHVSHSLRCSMSPSGFKFPLQISIIICINGPDVLLHYL